MVAPITRITIWQSRPVSQPAARAAQPPAVAIERPAHRWRWRTRIQLLAQL